MAPSAPSTVLITGASRGIGLQTARRFSAAGARVGLVARDTERLREVAAALPGPSHVVAADLSDREACRSAVAQVTSALGAIDVLVSCAGVLSRDFAEDVTEEDLQSAMALHAGAPLWLAQMVLPGMRARRAGSIVLVSSELAIIGAPTYAAYCMSKSAQLALADVLAHELAGTGVHVSAICPGDVATDQLREEHAWGPTGGVAPDKALDADVVARAIVTAVRRHRPLVVVDRLPMAVLFRLMAGPRRLRFAPVHDAFKTLLRERSPRNRER